MSAPGCPCFVCGEMLPLGGVVAIHGHRKQPAQDAVIRVHSACTARLALEALASVEPVASPARNGGGALSGIARVRVRVRAGLTDREDQILQRVAAGDTNRQIAFRFALAEKTVKNIISTIFSKLGVRSRTEAAILALRQGLVEPDGDT